jgi:polyhydroxybutyrate depolymerase
MFVTMRSANFGLFSTSTTRAAGVSLLLACALTACALDEPTENGGASGGGTSPQAGSSGNASGGKASAGSAGTNATAGNTAAGGAGAGGINAGGSAGKAVAGSSSGGSAGSAAGNAAGGTGGQAGSGGGQGGALGGAGAGGTGGSSLAGDGGMSGGGAAGSSSGGSSGGGAGGAGGTGAGGKAPVDPSAGCGKANPQTGSSNSPLNVSNHQYYVKLPAGYDASEPYPVIFMFNPTGNPLNWAEQNAGFESNGAKDGAIRVYPGPLSMSSGWGANDVSFFRPLYDTIIGNFCVDKARVFAAGESSGGDFSSILGCEHADVLRAVGPCATKDVQGYPLDATRRECTGQVTSVVIHGKMDNVVGTANGPKTRDFYLALNNCTMTSAPVEGYTDDLSNCVEYSGCDDGYPVFWCSHGDPEYNNTNHGWPRFAARFLWELFSSY